MSFQSRALTGRRIAAIAILATVLIAAYPPVRSRVKGTLVSLEALSSPIRPLSAITLPPRVSAIELTAGKADLYSPRGLSTAPRLVVIHGANPQGKDDDRVRRLATALARAGREVLVPQLELRNGRLDLHDLQRIREAMRTPVASRVGILAFSYGAGLALVAAAEKPEIQERVGFIATVGTYFDLRHLLYGVTTGFVPYHGSLLPWQTIEDARDLVAEQLASFIGGPEGTMLLNAWRTKDPLDLPLDVRAVYVLLENTDPARVEALVAALPEGLRDLLSSLSPSESIEAISVPVFALHSAMDQAAPITQSRLLVEALEPRVKTALFEVDILEHVTPITSSLSKVEDVGKLAAFAAMIVEEQEKWPRI